MTSITLSGQETNAGTYTNEIVPSAAAIGENTGNYEISYVKNTLTIKKKEAKITVDNKSKIFGAIDPILTGTVDGLINSGDLGTITYQRTNTAETVGVYEDVLNAIYTANENYIVTVIKGDFEIKRATMTVTAVDYEGVYDAQNHAGGATASVTEGTTIQYSTDNGTTWTGEVPSITNVGTVNYIVKATNPNYEDATDAGTLTVTKAPLKIEMPYALSFMATNDFHGYVPGINDILNGYTTPDGKVEPSIDEKIERGKKAIVALADYRKARQEGVPVDSLSAQLATINENMKYFGYGYIKDKDQVVPYIPINFWAFRIMVGIGCLLILFFAIVIAGAYKWPAKFWKNRDITSLPNWHYWLAIALIPLTYIASESGWLVAEFGRQPWTIQDMLPTWVAVSDLHSSSVIITFFLFLILFTTMLAVEINILIKQIKKGPDYSA